MPFRRIISRVVKSYKNTVSHGLRMIKDTNPPYKHGNTKIGYGSRKGKTKDDDENVRRRLNITDCQGVFSCFTVCKAVCTPRYTTMVLGITWRRLSTNVRSSEPVTRLKRLVKVAFSDKYLIYTNVTISISLSSLGDAMEQSYEIYTQDLDKFDGKRTAHMAFSGAAVGVLCHSWYKVLDRVIIGKSLEMVTKKLLLDQLVFSPIMILTFFGSLALFEKNPLQNFKSEVGDKFVQLYRAEWMVWPPAQVINFYFLPTRFRVLYDNTISLGYDVYTSQVKHNKCGTQKTVNVLTS